MKSYANNYRYFAAFPWKKKASDTNLYHYLNALHLWGQHLNLQVWTENADGTGAVNFITGMGGFLQSLLFGYGGFRIYPERIDFHGRLPPSTTCFNITGVDYLGGSLDFSFTDDTTTVKLTKEAKHSMNLKYEEKTVPLIPNKQHVFKSKPASLQPDFPPLPTRSTVTSGTKKATNVAKHTSSSSVSVLALTLMTISRYMFL